MDGYGSVAVVIPTHNRRDLVLQAVRSVLDQTYSDVRCVVVDNGSTDGTAEALATCEDPRLTAVIDERPLRCGVARNLGIAAASDADWVAFLDSDDLWAPRKLELQLAAMRANPPARLSATSSVQVDADLRVVSAERLGLGRPTRSEELVVTQQELLTQLREKQSLSFTISTFLAPKELLEQAGCCDTELRSGDDWDLLLRLARSSELAYVDLPLLAYRRWDGQMSSNWKRSMLGNATIRARHLPPDVQATRQQRAGWALYAARHQVADGQRVAACWSYVRGAWFGRAPGQLAYALAAAISPPLTEKRLRRFDRAALADRVPTGWGQEVEPWLAPYRASHEDPA